GARLRRLARPSRRRRRPRAGLDARRLAHARRGGCGHRAARARRRRRRGARQAHAPARRAPRRPARPARGQPRRRQSPRRARRARRRGRGARGLRRRARLRRAAHAHVPGGARRRRSHRHRRPRGRGRRPRSRGHRHRGGRRAPPALRRPAAARRQPELPSRRDAVGRVLRRARADRSGHPRERGRLPPGDRRGARRQPAERAPAGRRRRRQRRDLQPRRRSRPARLRPRARTGDDEQPHARQRSLHVLRDAGRQPGRLPRRRRPQRRARGHVEHAQHPGRGARADLPAARRRVRAAAGVGRRRAPARRRRRRARGGGARRRDVVAADRTPPPRAARGRRRRGRRARAQRRRGRGGRAQGDGHAARRGAPAAGDAGRRRPRGPMTGPELVARTYRRLDIVGYGAHGLGALVLFVFVTVLVPRTLSRDEYHQVLVRTAAALAVVLVVALWLGRRRTVGFYRGATAWAADGRPATDADRERLLRYPLEFLRTATACWVIGGGAIALVDLTVAPSAAVAVAVTAVLGGTVASSLCLILSERLLRPLVGRALAGGPPPEAASVGVAARLATAWALSTAVPLLGGVVLIGADLAGADFKAGDLAGAVLFLILTALSVGLLANLVVIRSLADSIGSVRAALQRIQAGDLETRCPVDDGSEVGLLQAGFNRMVVGLEERERLREAFGTFVDPELGERILRG